MGDTETLFLMLGIVYLMECCLPADKNALVFAPGPFARKARQGFSITLKSALLFLNPLPLFSRALVCELAPVSLCASGAALYNSLLPDGGTLKSGHGVFIPYAEITRLEAKGARLRVNELEIPCADGERAERLALELQERVALLKTKERLGRPANEALERKLCADLAPAFDVRAARARWREVLRSSRAPAISATLLFLHIFAVLPVGLLLSSYRPVWYLLGGVLLALHFMTVFFFWRGYRKLYPERGEERLKKLLSMFCNPFSSMRCPTQLCREGLAGFHPLLAGYIILRGRARQKFMHRAWCGLMYGLPAGEKAAFARKQLATHNALLASMLKRKLAEAGELLEPPLLRPVYDPAARAYCPSCLVQYAAELDECAYCPGVPLCKLGPPGP